jgi:RimJ/RimL family protein N-acetyltransferase
MTIIETKRLILSKLSVDDAPFILALLNDSEWLQFIGDKGVRTIDDARKYILNGPIKSYEQFGFGLYLTMLKDSNTPIGICGLLKRDHLDHVDLGFALLPEFRRKGYTKESASAVLKYGKSKFKFDHILAITQPDNINSVNVLKKLGFMFERMVEIPGNDSEVQLFTLCYHKKIVQEYGMAVL